MESSYWALLPLGFCRVSYQTKRTETRSQICKNYSEGKEMETQVTAMDNIKTAQATVDKAIGMVETMLIEREKTHGNFRDHARCTQRLKAVLRDELEIVGKTLTMEQQEALDMIFHKIGRMVAGNADFIDHWDDSAGYSTLVAKILRGEL